MGKSLRGVLLAAALVWGGGGVAGEIVLPKLPGGPALVDGELAEPCWEKALVIPTLAPLGGQGDDDAPDRAVEKTEARAFVADDALYIGFTCFFENEKAKRDEIGKALKSPFTGDAVEVFVDPGAAGRYAQLALGVGGAFFSVGVDESPRHAIQVKSDRWTAEIAIPFDAFILPENAAFPPRPVWRLNLCRSNPRREPKEFSTWAPLKAGTFHDAAGFLPVAGIDFDLNAARARQRERARTGDLTLAPARLILLDQPVLDATVEIGPKLPIQNTRLRLRLEAANVAANAAPDAEDKAPSVEIAAPLFTNTASLPVADLPVGKYVLRAVLIGADGKVLARAEHIIRKIPAPAGPPAIRMTIRGNAIFRDGEFFFPIVGTHQFAPVEFADRDDFFAKLDAGARDAKSRGFNAVWANRAWYTGIDDPEFLMEHGRLAPWNKTNWRRFREAGIDLPEIAERLAAHGIAVIPEFPYISGGAELSEEAIDGYLAMMARYRDNPHILFYMTSDECDAALAGNRLRHRLYKEADPGRLTWLNVINAAAQNIDAADIVGTDPYPVRRKGAAPLGMVATHAANLANLLADRPGQSSLLFLQLFGDDTYFPPSAAQVEVMAFLALNRGVGGLAYFMYVPPERRAYGINQDPNSWTDLARINRRLRELAPVFCQGERRIPPRDDALDVCLAAHGDSYWLAVINPEAKIVDRAVIPLPAELADAQGRSYEGDPVRVKDGALTLSLPAHGVRHFRFPRQAPAAASERDAAPKSGDSGAATAVAVADAPSASLERVREEAATADAQDGIRLAVRSEPPLPVANLIEGKADFTDGLPGWNKDKPDVEVRAGEMPGVPGGVLHAGKPYSQVYRQLDMKIFTPGVEYILGAWIRPDAEIASKRAPGAGLGASLVFYSQGSKDAAGATARDEGPPTWRRVVSKPLRCPEWAASASLTVGGSMANTVGLVRDIGVAPAYAELAVAVVADDALRQVKIVDDEGRVVFDSGPLTGGDRSFAAARRVPTPYRYTVLALTAAGRAASLTYPAVDENKFSLTTGQRHP